MRSRAPFAVAVIASTGLATACLPRSRPLPLAAERPQPCLELIDHTGRAQGGALAWHTASDPDTRRKTDEWCATIGPAEYRVPETASSRAHEPADELVVATWNVHVGGGDLDRFVADLRAGLLTGGAPVREFVLLLQETFRDGPAVPDDIPAGVEVPERIAPHGPDGERRSVFDAAREHELAAFYLPAVRNGPAIGNESEDRGNAILATRPLSELIAIELPSVNSRRVTAAATIAGVDSAGEPWRLRVASAHLQPGAGIDRLWLFSAAARERQAQQLSDLLGRDDVPTVLGADLNTWAGGPREPAYRILRRAFPHSGEPAGPTFRGRLVLDYLFWRLPPAWHAHSQTIPSRSGSDHHPLVARIQIRALPKS